MPNTYPVYPNGITHFVIAGILNNNMAFKGFLKIGDALTKVFPELLTDELLQAKVGLALVPRREVKALVQNKESSKKRADKEKKKPDPVRITADGYTMTTIARPLPLDFNGGAWRMACAMAHAYNHVLHPYIPLHFVSTFAEKWSNEQKNAYLEYFDHICSKFSTGTHIAARHVEIPPKDLRDRGYDKKIDNEQIFSSFTADEALRTLCELSHRAVRDGLDEFETDNDGKLFMRFKGVKGYAVEVQQVEELKNNKAQYKYKEEFRSMLYEDPKNKSADVHNAIVVIPTDGAIAYFHTEENQQFPDPMYVKTMFPLPVDASTQNLETRISRTDSTETFDANAFLNR